MARHLTPEQVKDEIVAAMGSPLGDVFHGLYDQLAWLSMKWHDSVALFDDKLTVDLLNDTAPRFFYDIRRILWESVVLHICRLTDPKESCGNKNLSIEAMTALVPEAEDPTFLGELNEAASDCAAKTDFARKWRNKQLAHKELGALAGGTATSLPTAGKEQIEDAITSLGTVLNCVERYYMHQTTEYASSLSMIDTPFGVRQLLHYLEKGLEAQRQEEAEQRGHRPPPEG